MKSQMVKVQVAKQEKSKTSCKKIELKKQTHEIISFWKNIIQFDDINHANSGTMIPKKQSEV